MKLFNSVYRKKLLATALFSTAAMIACGGEEKGSPTESSQLPETITTDSGEVLELSQVGVEVSGEGSGLYLASAESFKLQVTGCASGYATSQLTDPVSVNVYKFDRNCVAQLSEVTVGGIVYTPPASPNWAAGQVNEFSATGGEKLNITVQSNLNNPVSGTETIQFAYAEIESSAGDNLGSSDVSDGHAISVGGEEAPAFLMRKVELVGITVGGEGQYQITMECEENLVSGASDTCKSQDLSGMKFKLIEDTYSGSLTLAEAASLFPADELSIQSGDIFAAGSDATYPAGGFKPTVDGPGQLHSTANPCIKWKHRSCK